MATTEAVRLVYPRLTLLLPQAEPPATEARPSGRANRGGDPSARLATLEDAAASRHDRLFGTVATLVDDRLARR